MYVKCFTVKSFRLLVDARLDLDAETTVIVGRNNSGKTSLAELFRRFATERASTFKLEDFSVNCHAQFLEAYGKYRSGREPVDVRTSLPYIELRVEFSYSNMTDFGPLAEFIVDLDVDCFDAVAVIRYELADGKIDALFEGIEFDINASNGDNQDFFKELRPRIPKLYSRVVWAEDPADGSNRRQLDWRALDAVLCADFVTAQRGLDDVTEKESDSLAKIFESLFNAARSSGAHPDKRETAFALEAAVREIEDSLDSRFKASLQSLIPSMELIGYPGLNGSEMFTETKLEVEKLLSDNTRVQYASVSGVPLPESYNGLGARNLIVILLRLVGFYREFSARGVSPGAQVIFIEEPEVHLHPQMQEVFIRQLHLFAKDIVNRDGAGERWPVQFIVSTHSSHIANEAPFTSIRYFLTKAPQAGRVHRQTIVKDLSKGVGGVAADDINFIHQYLTLTKCDLFFADKAILVEGTTERLLLPRMIKLLESDLSAKRGLSSQYVTLLEVGGAYAHKFFGLLDFLDLPVLIVTDLDSVGHDRKKCSVGRGVSTSNYCIQTWMQEVSPTIQQLLSLPVDHKIQGRRRLAFQVPEKAGGACGRSFEDAFILANRELFSLSLESDETKVADEAYELASNIKKAEFALKYATSDCGWVVPRYILEALIWLLEIDLTSDIQVRTSVSTNVVVGVPT